MRRDDTVTLQLDLEKIYGGDDDQDDEPAAAPRLAAPAAAPTVGRLPLAPRAGDEANRGRANDSTSASKQLTSKPALPAAAAIAAPTVTVKQEITSAVPEDVDGPGECATQ